MFKAGATISKYEIIELVGQGGSAQVYHASHTELKREVALKVLLPELAARSDLRAQFMDEARIAIRFNHPHIVEIFDLIDQGPIAAIAMEYLRGGDVRRWRQATPQPNRRVLMDILAQTALALDHIHTHGLVHRDVKPSNIMLTAEPLPGGRWVVKLNDFGLTAPLRGSPAGDATIIQGSAPYIAPEQAEGISPLTGAADQYALAMTAYELFTGTLPFQGSDPIDVMARRLVEDPPAPSRLPGATCPPDLDAVILRGLARQPEQRYPTCTAFVDALEAAWLAVDERDFARLRQEGEQLIQAGDYETAWEKLTRADALFPQRPDLKPMIQELKQRQETAQAYRRGVQAWRDAMEQATGLLQTDPNYPDAQLSFATLGLRKAPPPWPNARAWWDSLSPAQMLVGLWLGALAAICTLLAVWGLMIWL